MRSTPTATAAHRLTRGLRLGPLGAALDSTGRDREDSEVQKWKVEGRSSSERRWAGSEALNVMRYRQKRCADYAVLVALQS
jgi:hypothetical protein